MAEPFFLYPSADSKSLVVWDMERQHTMGQLEGHDGTIHATAVRGSLAVSCQHSGTVRSHVWNLGTMQCTATLPGEENGAFTLSACCMEGKVILGQQDGIINVWDVAASAPVALADLEGHTSLVSDVKAVAAGSMVLSGSNDMTMRLWDLRIDRICVRTMEGHSRPVWSVDLDGQCRIAVSSSSDKTVKLWDLGSGRCTETYRGFNKDLGDLVMHESGSSFLCSEYDRFVIYAWAVGSTRAVMRADMASSPPVPGSEDGYRLFASKDLLTVAFCSCITGPAGSQLGVSVWKQGMNYT